eukprot:14535616-Alexandrium_andersonii.AAC.1
MMVLTRTRWHAQERQNVQRATAEGLAATARATSATLDSSAGSSPLIAYSMGSATSAASERSCS